MHKTSEQQRQKAKEQCRRYEQKKYNVLISRKSYLKMSGEALKLGRNIQEHISTRVEELLREEVAT